MISNATACRTLGVSLGATQQDIKAAWKRLMEQYHPDKNGGDTRFTKRAQEITEAYQFLSKGVKIPSQPKAKDKPQEPPKPEAPKPETKDEFWENWHKEAAAKDQAKTSDGPQSWTRTQDSPSFGQSWQEESLKKTRARQAEFKAAEAEKRAKLKEKHDNFTRLSRARMEQIREEFRKFGNLGRPNSYAYTKEEVERLFSEMRSILCLCRDQFWGPSPDRTFDDL